MIPKEQAIKELDAWLKFQEISDEQKELYKTNIGIFANAIQTGHVIIGENKEITQKLKYHFGAEVKIKELKYKPQLTVGEVENHKIGIDKDGDLRATLAHLSASTGELPSTLTKMNTKDFNISAAIILFFMV